MTPEDLFRMVRIVLMESAGEPSGGSSSKAFDALSRVLGKDWWKTFPVEDLERWIAQFKAVENVPLISDAIRQLNALVDQIKAERIAATSQDEPLDTWARVGDKIKEDNETVKREGFKGSSPGFGEGYKAGSRDQVRAVGIAGAELRVGDRVRKMTGDYAFESEVAAVFRKRNSALIRVVCESTNAGTEGMLHIFAPEQLQRIE